MRKNIVLFILFSLLMTLSACRGVPATTPPTSPPVTTISPTPTPSPAIIYNSYQLEYLLMARFPDIFWVDPDFYPISRGPDQEQTNALQQFPQIQANTQEFQAILEHLGLPQKTDYTDAEKLSLYREHKKLSRAVTLTPSGDIYSFSLRTGENQGLHIEGTITPTGQITVTRQEPSFNTYPICLTRGTMIATPDGDVAVENLPTGIQVWTQDGQGNPVPGRIIKTSSVAVPSGFQVVKITLNDGREISASPGHPTIAWRPLGNYRIGDSLDGGIVIGVEHLPYEGSTYDILPDGGTGLYLANGVWLKSTLAY